MDTNMGQLKEGATLIYERSNDTVYAREFGSDPSTRVEVGWKYDPRTTDGRPLRDHIQEDKLWGDIRRAAQSNATLQAEVDRVIATYHLIKDNGNKT
jgi:hypothetical protein